MQALHAAVLKRCAGCCEWTGASSECIAQSGTCHTNRTVSPRCGGCLCSLLRLSLELHQSRTCVIVTVDRIHLLTTLCTVLTKDKQDHTQTNTTHSESSSFMPWPRGTPQRDAVPLTVSG